MSFKRLLNILLILLLTVGVVCSCCSCAVSNSDNTENINDEYSIVRDISFSKEKTSKVLQIAFENTALSEHTYSVCKAYSSFLDEAFSKTVITRLEWLKLLLEKLGCELVTDLDGYDHIKDLNYFEGSEYYITAIENAVVYRGGNEFGLNSPASRQFVATSLVKGVGYDIDYKLECADYDDIDEKIEASTTVYLRYLVLDDEDCFNGETAITQTEVDFLLNELDLMNMLQGKKVMSFGDSIMHGTGNDDIGIATLIAQRYKMQVVDYSKAGATFGDAPDREQISDQIERAVEKGEDADFILLNGGTNDMRNLPLGQISDDFNYIENGREFFSQGMEYALGLLRDNYPESKMLYIRAHDMEFSLERNELHFGKTALDICKKWNVDVADVFNDTGFDAHNTEIKKKYTKISKNCEKGDSVHPNRLGYYEYYIPLTVEKMIKNINVTE